MAKYGSFSRGQHVFVRAFRLAYFQGQNTAEYGLLMAGTVVASVPVLIVYVLAQRFIIQSVASTGVKG